MVNGRNILIVGAAAFVGLVLLGLWVFPDKGNPPVSVERPAQVEGPAVNAPIPLPRPEASAPIHLLQLSSHRTLAEAGRARELHARAFPDLVALGAVKAFRVELDNGTWFRVGVLQPSRAEADAKCRAIKARGGECISISFSPAGRD